MKVITELIDYFLSSGELDDFDLRFLQEQGFMTAVDHADFSLDFEDRSDDALYDHYFAQEDHLQDLDNKAIADGNAQAKKGKGGSSKPRQPRLSLDDLNASILEKIDAWQLILRVLAAFTGLPKQGMGLVLLQKDTSAAAYEQISRHLKTMLIEQQGRLQELETAIFFTEHLDFVFGQIKRVAPAKRETVRRWLLDHAPDEQEKNREGFRFINHCVRLQRLVLMEWRKHHAAAFQTQSFLGDGYRFFHFFSPRVSLSFLLLEYSEKDLAIPAQPQPAHYFFEEDQLSQTFELLLTLFPRRFHYLFQNSRRAGLPPGVEYIGSSLRQALSWMPVPAWLLAHNGLEGVTWVVSSPIIELSKEDLVLETDWFRKVSSVTDQAFCCEAQGFAICKQRYQDAKPCTEGRLAVMKGGSWGYVDRQGKWIVPPKYAAAAPFSEGLGLVMMSPTQHFYLDRDGNIVLEISKWNPEPFSEGLAVINDMVGDCYYIDASGTIIISPDAKQGRSFHEGKAAIQLQNNAWTFIDKAGRVLSKKTYDWAWDFREGRAVVKKGRYYGFLDENGKEVIPCQYTWAWSFNEGRAGVEENGLNEEDGIWYYIDRNGARTSAFYRMVEYYAEGMGGVYLDTDQWSFIDLDGSELPPLEISESTEAFSHGFALINEQTFIDKSGETKALHSKYWTAATSFSEGYAFVKNGFRQAIINVNFERLTDFTFHALRRFPGEFAAFERARENTARRDWTLLPYTNNDEKTFFEGTALDNDGYDVEGDILQLIFKSEFKEESLETLEDKGIRTLNGRLLWAQDNCFFMLPEGIELCGQFSDKQRIYLKNEFFHAIVNWEKTQQKLLSQAINKSKTILRLK